MPAKIFILQYCDLDVKANPSAFLVKTDKTLVLGH